MEEDDEPHHAATQGEWCVCVTRESMVGTSRGLQGAWFMEEDDAPRHATTQGESSTRDLGGHGGCKGGV